MLSILAALCFLEVRWKLLIAEEGLRRLDF